jgi:hypothetical protein
VPANPWAKSVTLTTANTAYNLWALLQAADKSLQYSECCKLQIQSAIVNGGANLYIGNADVSSTNRGAEIVASQAFGIEAIEQNLIDLKQIFLVSDTNAVVVNVMFMVH